MTKGKPNWQCVTRYCGEPKADGDLCETCARTPGGKRAVNAYTPPPKPECAPKVYATGATRRLDGRNEQQMTDGRQQWWVGA